MLQINRMLVSVIFVCVRFVCFGSFVFSLRQPTAKRPHRRSQTGSFWPEEICGDEVEVANFRRSTLLYLWQDLSC